MTYSYSGPMRLTPSLLILEQLNSRYPIHFTWNTYPFVTFLDVLTMLAQMVACLPLVQQARSSIPGGIVNFHLKIFNPRARRGGDVHFLIARLYITGLD